MKRESRWWHKRVTQDPERRDATSSPIADGRRAYDYVSRQTFIVCAIIMSVVLTMTLAAVVLIALAVNDIQTGEIIKNGDAIRRLDRATGELRALTQPTPEQYRQQLTAGIRRCAAEPLCRKALRDLVK